MSNSKATPRRSVPNERYLYVRTNAVGQKVYEVGWRDSERKQHWRTVDGGIIAARAERDRIIGERSQGARVQANPRLTFREACKSYEAKLDERVQGGTLNARTRHDYARIVRLHLAERFTGRRLGQIHQEALDRLMADMRRDGRSERTILKVLNVLSEIFKHADNRLGWKGENPVTARARADRPKPSKTAKPRRIFTRDELRGLLDCSREPYRMMFRLMADTGARISEVLGLRIEDLWLDDEDPLVTFAGQISEAGEYVGTKTEASSGTVAITAATAASLRAHLAGEHAGTTYVFETSSGTPYDRHNVARVLRTTLRGLRDEDGELVFRDGERLPSAHSFRHSVASYLLNAGASADDVARRLRHKDATVTRAVYIHEIEDAKRRAADRGMIEGVLG